ncbi:hypothetical protein IG193_07445 [Infirmifilum lucidum]|uniref:Uncharacterized protein n=1 Tax=Infirmifilum lucidum TaxID=2776706 RepID=A0A7L9FHU8_9CREN|nr:hypothetical protein [Infirmifilum lucidum]QOJ78583.1 hypothetical protein IG193_07445 [Infirmifilum lucidum]
MSADRTFEIEGVKFTILEGFRDLHRVLSSQPPNARWDVLVLDRYMTAEIVSLGNRVRVALYAEVETEKTPESMPADQDIDFEVEPGKVKLRFLGDYTFQGRTTVIAIINRINKFREVLSRILT